MCIICTGLDEGNLAPWEADRNRWEMINEIDEEHMKVIETKIAEALVLLMSESIRKKNENKNKQKSTD